MEGAAAAAAAKANPGSNLEEKLDDVDSVLGGALNYRASTVFCYGTP